MVVPEVPESLSSKPKLTPKTPSNNSTATNSTDDTSMSAKIVTPVPNANNTAEAMVVEEEDSESEGLLTEVEDMDSEEGINVGDLAVGDTDEVDMAEVVMVVVEEEEDMVEG